MERRLGVPDPQAALSSGVVICRSQVAAQGPGPASRRRRPSPEADGGWGLGEQTLVTAPFLPPGLSAKQAPP